MPDAGVAGVFQQKFPISDQCRKLVAYGYTPEAALRTVVLDWAMARYSRLDAALNAARAVTAFVYEAGDGVSFVGDDRPSPSVPVFVGDYIRPQVTDVVRTINENAGGSSDGQSSTPSREERTSENADAVNDGGSSTQETQETETVSPATLSGSGDDDGSGVVPRRYRVFVTLRRLQERYGRRPSEREVSEELGIARGSVNREVKRLRREGMIADSDSRTDEYSFGSLPDAVAEQLHSEEPQNQGTREEQLVPIPAGVGTGKARVYVALREFRTFYGRSPSMTELAKVAGVTNGSAGGHLTHLKSKGCIQDLGHGNLRGRLVAEPDDTVRDIEALIRTSGSAQKEGSDSTGHGHDDGESDSASDDDDEDEAEPGVSHQVDHAPEVDRDKDSVDAGADRSSAPQSAASEEGDVRAGGSSPTPDHVETQKAPHVQDQNRVRARNAAAVGEGKNVKAATGGGTRPRPRNPEPVTDLDEETRVKVREAIRRLSENSQTPSVKDISQEAGVDSMTVLAAIDAMKALDEGRFGSDGRFRLNDHTAEKTEDSSDLDTLRSWVYRLAGLRETAPSYSRIATLIGLPVDRLQRDLRELEKRDGIVVCKDDTVQLAGDALNHVPPKPERRENGYSPLKARTSSGAEGSGFEDAPVIGDSSLM